MLVLKRKVGEKIVIPQHQITITVIDSCMTFARLGIDAPESVDIFREEVWEHIEKLKEPKTRRVKRR